jgi:hypothetical protein
MACPIPHTHSRLDEAHRLWHRAAASYEDPDEFRTNLNALIQALRNVTFVLQGEKQAIHNFETWYENWRDIMRQDEVMKWLVAARNRVVKKGDLETYSTAAAGIQASWDEPELVSFNVPPLYTTEAIAATAAQQDIPDDVRKGGILTVERRWVASDLPEYELLDALAHCFGMLILLVADAHRQAGAAMHSDDDGEHDFSLTQGEDGRPRCMVATAPFRTATVNLRTGDLIEAVFRPVPMTAERGRNAERRYGLPELEPPPQTRDPLDWAPYYMEIAKRILARDKYHVEIAFLFPPNGPPYPLSTMPQDQQTKYLFMNDVATEVKRSGAKGIIVVADAWWLPPGIDLPPGKRPGEMKERVEGLHVTAARSDGSFRSLMTTYRRRLFGRIEFDETLEAGSETVPLFLGPVLRVWGVPTPSQEDVEKQVRGS